MPFNFIEEYIRFNAGNEVPVSFHRWSALAILAAAAHKRVYADLAEGNEEGYFRIHPMLFITLVAKQGKARKSTAKDIAADLFMTALPKYPLGAAVQSREDIVRNMSGDSQKITYIDEKGINTIVTPCMFFVNELKNFLSVDPEKMVAFLTDIYDRKKFDSGTIKRGGEVIINPCVSILACEVPDWITDKLKSGIVTGGFARRMIYIYETERAKRIAFPAKPTGHADMFERLRNHLVKIYTEPIGRFQWTQEARDWYRPWYENMVSPDDEIMSGYYESKHIQLLKVAMCLALAEEDIKLQLTLEHFVLALAMLDEIEVNMPKLALAAGRNELALPTQKLLEVIETQGGWMPDKVFTRIAGRDLNMSEIAQVKRHLQDTEQLVIQDIAINGVIKKMVMTKAKHLELEKQRLSKQEQETSTPKKVNENKSSNGG